MTIPNNSCYVYGMEEVWKDVPEYQGIYQVSNLGRVKVLDRPTKRGKGVYLRPGRVLKPTDNGKGYKVVHLYKNGNMKNVYVHILVKSTFEPNPNPAVLTDINHINEDKSDNRLCNLEWCDRSYNLKYGTHNQKMIETKIKKGQYNPDYVGLDKAEYFRRKAREYYWKKKNEKSNI